MRKGYNVTVTDNATKINVRENTACRCGCCELYTLAVEDLINGSAQEFEVLGADSDREYAYVTAIDMLARRVKQLEEALNGRPPSQDQE